MKELWTIVKQELQEGENIWITTQNKFNSNDSDWWKFNEFTFYYSIIELKSKFLRKFV